VHRELVTEFFMLFARAEFALKRAGFVINYQRGERVDVDWDRFACSLGDAVTSPTDDRILEGVKYLQRKAPKKQVLRNGQLQWKDRPCPDLRDPKFVIRSITTVRNNLFHGGKEIVGLMAERDRQLLENSSLVLAYCLKINEEVYHAFEELGPEEAVA
jgi:hypothetical protein